MKETTEVVKQKKPRKKAQEVTADDKQIMLINPQQLITAAINKGVTIDVMERLLEMARSIKRDAAEQAFREALSQFQAACPIIEKTKIVYNRDGKTIRYKYAPIDDIIRQVQPLLDKYGFSYDVETSNGDGQITVSVTACHALGHSKKTSFTVPILDNEFMNAMQHWASAQTYAKRYAFCNAFGILTGDEDDDTHEENEREKERQAIIEKLQSLPDDIKQGLKLLDYTGLAAFRFCEQHAWQEETMRKELHRIADRKAAQNV